MNNDALWRDIHQQWQASPLLRLGSWAIVLILLGYLLLWMDDHLALEQLEWHRAEVDIAELQLFAQQDYWPAYLEALETRRDKILEQAWSQRTTGLAKAAAREFINKSSAESAVPLRVRSIELTEPKVIVEGIYEMKGRFSVSTDESTVPWAWIASVENATPALFFNSVDIRVGSKSGVAVVFEFRMLLDGLEEGRAE